MAVALVGSYGLDFGRLLCGVTKQYKRRRILCIELADIIAEVFLLFLLQLHRQLELFLLVDDAAKPLRERSQQRNPLTVIHSRLSPYPTDASIIECLRATRESVGAQWQA